jgi:predicted ATPase/tetratricopeptide (TPR) repeat protein/DNA-binding XRE family transcriptional regulator
MAETQSFGQWLHHRRRELDLTQSQLGSLVNCAQVTIKKIEADILRPSRQLAELLVEKLGIPAEERESYVRFARSGAFPSEALVSTPRNNLPAELTSFIGREQEIEEVTRLLGTARLVTVTGAGGVGKSRLALQVAARALDHYQEGAWFVELAAITNPEIVPLCVATALGMQKSRESSYQSMLIQFLQEKHLLLILDNCEHLIEACAQLAYSILLQCSKVTILTTCRETLDVEGEVVYRLPSLTNLDPLHTVNLHELEQTDSVRLFTERATALLPDFCLTSQNLPAVARICYRLDGIPLAIELAAARISALSVEEIAERLDNRFRLLIIGNRTALPRHRTLRASIDWSYNLLPEPERLLLQRLSVFAGGWTLEAAEGVCAWDGLEPSQIVDALTGLVKKSLVQTVRSLDSLNRFRMLETIRQYAQEKLVEAGQVGTARDHHLAYFLSLVEQLEPGLRGRELVQTLDHVELELDNLRMALECGLRTNVEAELSMASALLWFWHVRYRNPEGIEWLQRGLAAAQESRSASSEVDQLTKPIVHPRVRVKAMAALGFLEDQMDRPDLAKPILSQGLELYRQSGIDSPQDLALILLYLGDCERFTHNLDQARILVNQALGIYMEINDHHGMAGSWQTIGYMETDPVEKKKIHQEELVNAEASGDEDKIATALFNLGLAEWTACEYEKVWAYFQESRRHFLKDSNYASAAILLLYCSNLAKWSGDYQQAKEFLHQARDDYQQHNCLDKYFYLFLAAEAELVFLQDLPSETVRCLEDLRAYSERVHNMELMACVLCLLARLERNQGEIERAKLHAQESLKLSQDRKLIYNTMDALNELGNLAGLEGNYPLAYSQLCESLKVEYQLIKRDCAKPFASLISLAVRLDEVERANRLFGALERHFRGYPNLLSRVERTKFNEDLDRVKNIQGPIRFKRFYEEGYTLAFVQAVGLAMQETS